MSNEGYLKNGVYYQHNDFKPGRPCLVFVHGISGCCSAWKPYGQHFAGDCNLLFFDLRGHGKSFKKKDGSFYSLDLIADDIYEMALMLGIKKMFLVGHSFGALLAVDFATKYPEKMGGLILLAPDYRINKTFRGRVTRTVFAAVDLFSTPGFTERYGVEVDYSRFRYNDDWDWRRIYIDVKNTSIHVYHHCLSRSTVFDPEEMVGRIKVPSLIIHGRKDSVFPFKDSVQMAKKIPNARLKILDNANHILVLNNSGQIITEIDNFLKSVNA